MDTSVRIGTLNVAFIRDTRDEIVNATRGMFLSQSIRYAPGFLGSNVQFIRYFGEYNTYPKISNFSFFDVRKTAGFGFRLHTPFVLVRFDWGFKLDRRPGEALSQIFFSIDQAF